MCAAKPWSIIDRSRTAMLIHVKTQLYAVNLPNGQHEKELISNIEFNGVKSV